MKTGSLCSGYEGLGLAVHAVIGGELAWVADNDPGAAAVLAHHFPSAPNFGDITGINWSSVEPVDVLTGGFPCQDVSAAGARSGLKRGNRSGLWHEFATAIGVLRPGLVVIENVHGLLTARGDEPTPEHLAAEASRDSGMRLLEWLENELALAVTKGNGRRARQCRARADRVVKLRKRAAALCQWHEQRLIRAAGTVLASLAALGYDAEWVVVTASAAGACHRRARMFILAFPASGRAAPGVPVAVIADGEWLEPGESLFGMLPFTGRIPASGSMAGGRVYAAAGGPAVTGAGLLKTPTAQLAVNGGSQHPDKRRAGGHGPTLADQVEHELLPTPTAADGDRASLNYERGNPTLLGALLPTPQATDGQGGPRAVPEERTHWGQDHGPRLRDVAPALLPTPSVADGTGGHKTRSGSRSNEPLLGGIAMLLPTPTSNVSGRTGEEHMAMREAIGRSTPSQLEAAAQLLPTPSAGNFNDGEDLASWEARRQRNLAKGVNGNGQGTPLPIAAQQLAGAVDWGPYEAAIRRWEAVTGRMAPPPTVPGKTGQRLNAALPEWMMGLPAGWITGVPGLSRNAMLKLAGNGVVPQQGILALRILLERAGIRRQERAA